MKKKILIGAGIVVLVALLVVTAVLIFKAPPMLTQPRENLTGVSIILDPSTELTDEDIENGMTMASKTIELKQKADMWSAYYVVSENTKRKSIGTLKDGLAYAPAYEIVFSYADGTQDTIIAAEDTEYILRCVNPDAPEAERKYIRAKCVSALPHVNLYAY